MVLCLVIFVAADEFLFENLFLISCVCFVSYCYLVFIFHFFGNGIFNRFLCKFPVFFYIYCTYCTLLYLDLFFAFIVPLH